MKFEPGNLVQGGRPPNPVYILILDTALTNDFPLYHCYYLGSRLILWASGDVIDSWCKLLDAK